MPTLDPATAATLGVMAATLILAGATVWLGVQTRATVREASKLRNEAARQAEATLRQADATTREADASRRVLEEMRIDRELAVRPYLTWDIIEAPNDGSTSEVHKVKIGNFGRGPAINCRFVSVQDGKRRQSLRFELSASEVGGIIGYRFDDPIDALLLAGHPQKGIQHALFCFDQFGTVYRFQVGALEADTSHKDDSESPDWARWYRVLPPGIRDLPPGAQSTFEL